MLDILLDNGGDLDITDTGDIRVGHSIPQAILVRLRWIEQEWRLGPDIGFPWFSQVFVKNPDLSLIAQSIRYAIMEVDHVVNATVEMEYFSMAERKIKFKYRAQTYTEEFVEEVVISG